MQNERALRSVQSPRPRVQLVVAAALNPAQRARLTDAVRGRSELRVLTSFDELSRALRSTIEIIDIVVVPSRDMTDADAAAITRLIVAERPRTAVVAYCEPRSNQWADVRALTAAGVHRFVISGIDDAGVVFRAALDAARQTCTAEWVASQLAPLLPAAIRPMVDVVLAAPADITKISQLASAMKVHRRTLFYRCERAGFLPPAELLTWARLALVADILESTGCTVETIANELGYPSVTALRNLIKRYTGQTASEIREQDGVKAVVTSLARRLATST